MEIILIILVVLVAGIAGAILYRRRTLGSEALPGSVVKPTETEKGGSKLVSEDSYTTKSADAQVEKAEPKSRGYSAALQATRSGLFGKMGKYLGLNSLKDLSSTEWDEIEEVLITGDVGLTSTQKLISMVREKAESNGGQPLRKLFSDASTALLDQASHGRPNHGSSFSNLDSVKPLVISIVGVNGVGKTTTSGKLAAHFRKQNKTVLLAAADTFRAGAIAQLRIWAERVGAEFVTGREGADPGAVAFDSVTAGKARGIDIVLLDTAGRLHTKGNLMEELKKIHRVVKKVIPEAPHERWLVVDGTLGQNSVRQAKEFHEALDLTGIIITKLDGTAKGGVVFSIVTELGLPIRFIGLGETAEDLMPFEVKPFVDAIIGTEL